MATRKTDTADVFAFTAFDPSKLGDNYRDFAEKSLAQSKDNYTKMKSAAEEATKTVEVTLQTAQAGSVELGLKAIDFMRANTDSSLSHLEAMLGVKSFSEMLELQTAFVRKQLELTVDQAKAMQDTSRKVAEDVAKPGKSAVEKAAKDLKAA